MKRLLTTCVLAALIAPSAAAEPFAISLGRVDSHPRDMLERLYAITDALVDASGGALIAGPPSAYKTLDELAAAMRDGRVHYASETPFGALELEKTVGARILLREWRKGVARYHSVVVVRADSAVQSLAELQGRKVAFEDPGSTSAFFLPAAAMLGEGLTLNPMRTIRAQPRADVANYAFVGAESSVAFAVAAGVADAGGISNGDWRELGQDEPALQARLRILHRTPDVVRSVFLAGPGPSAAIDTVVTDAIRAMMKTADGRASLVLYNRAEIYDAIDEGEAAADLAAARRLYEAAAALPR